MDSTIIVPIILAILVIVAVIAIRRKHPSDKPKTIISEKTIEKKKEEIQKKDPEPIVPVIPPVVIYEDSYRNMRICPFCDGENDRSAVCCVICGERL